MCERERGGGGGFRKPAFTVRHVVVLLTTGSPGPLAGLGMHAERVKKSDLTK